MKPRNLPLTDTKFYHLEKNKLDLHSQQLTDQDIQQIIIPFLQEHPEITKLNVRSNCIGDNGARALASNTTLTKLAIWDNRIGGNGAKALASNTTLTNLDVSYNRIGDDGAKALASNTVLETLDVSSIEIGHSGVKALLETDPRIRANYGREVKIKTEVPSLLRLCLFKVKQTPNLDQNQLCDDLREKLAQAKV
jgi:hypothetical protein